MMHPNARLLALVAALCVCFFHPKELSSQATTAASPGSPTLVPHYLENEPVAYNMRAINEGHERTIRYEAHAQGVVKKDQAGVFVEEFAWSDVHVNGVAFPLPPASQEFRQSLSVSPEFKMSIPDLTKVNPMLIGPITDLLSFYADVRLAMKQKNLVRAGDHAYFKYGVPHSFADGTYVVLGQDAIDFDITLESIDPATQIATLVVRHVPPAQPEVKLSADWMLKPVGNTANNWTQIEKQSNGKFVAGVGQETFEDRIKFSLSTGRIVSATMDNPVEVMERSCDDLALTVCGEPIRYRIRRQIALEAVK